MINNKTFFNGSSNHSIYIKGGSICVFILFAFYLLLRNDYIWKWVEGLSLFIPDADFFHKFLLMPGGLLAYVGCYLTQFLYYPVIGCTLFVGLLYVVQLLTTKIVRFPSFLYPLSFFPSLMLLTAVLNVGYTWITLKSPGHFFVPALGCIFFLSCLMAYKRIHFFPLRVLSVFLIAATYPLFGFYALFATGLCLLYEWRIKHSELKYLAIFIIGLASIILIPKLYYFTINSTEQEISRLYVAGLPTFFIRRAELMLWMPFLLLLGYYVLLTLFPLTERTKHLSKWLVISISIYAMAMIFTAQQMYRNENFEASVRASLAMEDGNWSKVLEAVNQVQGSPTRDVAIEKRIGLMQMNMPQPSDELPPLLEVYKDSRPGIFTFMQLCGLPMHYYMGQINLCYRWGMELSVEYGWRVSSLKYMIKSALLQREFSLAQKYNDVLKKTAFHKDWAEKYQHYIDSPKRMKSDKEFIKISNIKISDTFVE